MAILLCEAAAVSADIPVRVILPSGLALAVFQVDDAFYVTDDRCTHGNASLSDGFVEDGEVECPFHQGRFDIKTGKATGSPCVHPLKTHAAFVEGGRIYIDG